MAEQVVRARVCEAVVLRHLLQLMPSRDEIHYFRRQDDLEIDFVFRRQDELHAVEVTSSTNLDDKKADRLRKAVGADRGAVIYRGATKGRSGNLRLLPLHLFLLNPLTLVEEAAR